MSAQAGDNARDNGPSPPGRASLNVGSPPSLNVGDNPSLTDGSISTTIGLPTDYQSCDRRNVTGSRLELWIAKRLARVDS